MMKNLYLLAVVACCFISSGSSFFFDDWNAKGCVYGNWSDCTKNKLGQYIKTRTSAQENCQEETVICDTGEFLAEVFLESFLSPSPSVVRGSNKDTQTTKKPKCREVLDYNGNLITGNCNTRRQKRQSGSLLKEKKRDLLLLLDESISVGWTDFQTLKKFASAIVSRLCSSKLEVEPDKTRVAVVSFNNGYRPVLFLNQSKTRTEVSQTILNMRYQGGGTCIEGALDYAMDNIMTKAYGGRPGEKDVQQDIILLTDGCSGCSGRGRIQRTVNRLERKNIHTYVFGLGLGSFCKDQVKTLAQGGKCNHFYFIPKVQLDVLIRKMENSKKDCQTQWKRNTSPFC